MFTASRNESVSNLRWNQHDFAMKYKVIVTKLNDKVSF